MAQVAADVSSGIETFGIEAISVDLVAAMVTIALGNGPLQLAVVGASLSKVPAKQVSPFGRQASRGEAVDFDPRTIFQTAFGHHQVYVWFEAQVTPKGVASVDETDANAGIEISHQFTDGLRRRLQEHLQKRAVGVEEGPQEVVGGEGDVEMGHIQQVAGDVVDPVVHPDRSAEFATKPCRRRGRSGFCRKRARGGRTHSRGRCSERSQRWDRGRA